MIKSEIIDRSGIFLSCTEPSPLVFEDLIPEHILVYIYEGKVQINTGQGTFKVIKGQAALLGRNQLAKFIKEPNEEHPYKAATVFLDRTFLKDFYAGLPEIAIRKPSGSGVIIFKNHPLLENLFRSISIFSDLGKNSVPDDLALLKIQEGLTIIRMLDHETDGLLSDFSEPHKIDLQDFMQKNYMFNISVSRFAYLTGRSLATFKRDFRKTFDAPPQKWLTESRLRLAHFFLSERNMKPSEVFVEAGFENFSHFTFAFKKFFGYNASTIVSRQTNDV